MPTACDENIDDIEDIFTSKNTGFNEHYPSRDYVIPRIRKSRKPKDDGENLIYADSIIPGTQTIYVKTWGCSHNSSDGEYMSGQLAAYGYKITEEKEKAHLWLLNSCTVKNPAEDHFHNAVNEAHKLGKTVVVAGCVPQAAPRQDYLKQLSIVGVQQIDRVVEVVEETLKGHVVRLLGQKKINGKKTGGASLQLPKIRKNPLIEIISINTGCLNQCTYCKTKHARGELGSYQIEELVERSEQSFKEGVCEIWLTSEDTGAYGRDIGVTLPQLLWRLIETIPEGAMLRIGMTNPPYILEHLEEMAKILNHPRVYSFLHIPVQSGSDSVLMDMKREYCIEDFKKVVDFLKQRVANITIATDIICGFPTETEEDFKQTMELVEQYKFPSLFINQYFPRPGTVAARLPRIPAQQVKQRTKRLSELFQSYQPYEHKLYEQQKILITEISYDKEHLVGHNKYYEQVLVPKVEELMGKMVNVKIIATHKHCLIGKLCSDSEVFTPSITPPLAPGEVSGLIKQHYESLQPQHTWWLIGSAVFLLVALVLRLICKFFDLRSILSF